MRVNILAQRDDLLHLDTLDLCKARSRRSFIEAVASELYMEESVIKRDIGTLLLTLEKLQQQQIEAATARAARVELTAERREAALALLRDPQLIDRILRDYQACGLVGEETNKLICYLGCSSRLLRQPLAMLIQSSSASGKTSLMDATLAFFPEETQIRYSALTGQSLYYMGRHDLSHKILAVAEEEGVAQAGYALKLLQSDGCLRIAATGKHQGTGRQQTESYEVEGPVMMFLTTTSPAPDEELANRCLLLQVNESRSQTAAIHCRQRLAYTPDGQRESLQRQQIIELHQDAQRLLEPLPVVIPWAEQLTFRDDQTRLRRDHAKYLALIAASTLLHQYQRPRRSWPATSNDDVPQEYLQATREDVALAGRLMAEVLGQSLNNLLPQTRQLLELLDDWVQTQSQRQGQPRATIRFTQRQLRETLGWGDFQLRRHLARLVELEFVLAHRSGRGNQRVYELVYQGQGRDGRPFLLGLINADGLDPACPPAERNDHSQDRNDAPSMPIRSACDAPSMPPENGDKAKAPKPLAARKRKRAPKVNGTTSQK